MVFFPDSTLMRLVVFLKVMSHSLLLSFNVIPLVKFIFLSLYGMGFVVFGI